MLLSICNTSGHWCTKWNKAKSTTHGPRIDTDKVFRISQRRNFKEFYWNKDKFQSQSLIVFEKRTLWWCANILWLFFKALFCLFSISYIRREIKKGGGRKKTLYNRSFWHNQLVQQFSCAGYFQTFDSPSERQVLAELLFHNGLFNTVTEVKYSSHGIQRKKEEGKKNKHSSLLCAPSHPTPPPQRWTLVGPDVVFALGGWYDPIWQWHHTYPAQGEPPLLPSHWECFHWGVWGEGEV